MHWDTDIGCWPKKSSRINVYCLSECHDETLHIKKPNPTAQTCSWFSIVFSLSQFSSYSCEVIGTQNMLSFPFKSLLPEGSKNTYCARGRNYLKAVALLAADLQVIPQITPSSSRHKNFKHKKHTHPHPRPHETACFLKILITELCL